METDYRQNWQRYRKLRLLFFLIWVGYIPVVYLFSLLVSNVLGVSSTVPIFVFAGLWMLLFAITGFRLSAWRCPRCGKWFAATWWYNKSLFARKCVHCGLPKFASGEPAPKS
jgi:Zn ribbon nucleic-acid-binding protein